MDPLLIVSQDSVSLASAFSLAGTVGSMVAALGFSQTHLERRAASSLPPTALFGDGKAFGFSASSVTSVWRTLKSVSNVCLYSVQIGVMFALAYCYS